jgi:tRNA threonylcarbamoyladenosine biosynthesis protein TsaB
MLVLAVDTSTRAGSVAVLEKCRLLGVRESCTTQPHASGLFVDLGALLDELRISLETFDLFAVASGPGSFTGLRIGLTAAKAWAEAFNRPVVPVSSLDAIVFQSLKLPHFPPGTAVASVLDARRGQVFGRVYDYDGGASYFPFHPRGEEMLLPAPEFVNLVSDQVGERETVFVSPALEPIQSALKDSAFRRYRVESVSGVLAPFIGEIGYARALQGKTVDALQLDANYVRRTDAEVKWVDAKRKDDNRKDDNRENANRSDGKSQATEWKDPSLT